MSLNFILLVMFSEWIIYLILWCTCFRKVDGELF